MTAFLPAMQFGVPPWYFDEETNIIAKNFVSIHEDKVYPYIKSIPLDGQPIIRPMWWAEPLNEKTYSMTDQFYVGNNLLVAPILDSGITLRSIYIPSGYWVDVNYLCMYTGPITINYNVTLQTIPFFYNEQLFKIYFQNAQALAKC